MTSSIANEDVRVERLRRHAAVLSESVRAFAEESTSLRRLLDTIAEKMSLAVNSTCAIALPSTDGVLLEAAASFDPDPVVHQLLRRALTTPPLRIGAPGLTTSVFATGEPFFTPKIDVELLLKRYDAPEERAQVEQLGIGSFAVVAMRSGGKSVGVLTLLRHGTELPFDDDEVRLAQSHADHAALAIANARLFEALKASEARLSRIVETADEGIWVTDAERKTTFANRRMAEMLRMRPDELVGVSALEFVPKEDRGASDDRLERRRAGLSEQVEGRLLRRDGTLLDVAVSVSAVHEDGRFVGQVALVTDCTERKAVEEQLRHSQRMEAVGQLAGGIAHDFNNMLSVILSFSELALDDLPLGSLLHSDIGEIKKAGERARDLTRQILAFSRKQIMQPQVVDANVSLTSIEPMLRRLIGEDVALTFALDAQLGHIKADPGQLEQVLVNLAVNARDAMPQGGKLTIETANVDLDGAFAQTHLDTKAGPYVMIAVTDTGHGMNKDVQRRIFEPFFTTKDVGKGTGLGLSTVFGIVKQSGGSIWLYSEPGRGTAFKLYFPRTHELTAAATEPATPSRRTGTETVLIVEDDELVRNLTTTLLQRAGYRVLAATCPSRAVELSAQHDGIINLLLTDVIMPEMNGKQLADHLTSSRPQMRVLYTSGYTEGTIVHHGVLDDDVAFVAKPITPDALLTKVRTVLDA